MNAFNRRADKNHDDCQKPKACESILIDKDAHWIDIAPSHIARTLRDRRGNSEIGMDSFQD
jgi:hypothetical protein